MRTSALILISLFILSSCKEDDKDSSPTPNPATENTVKLSSLEDGQKNQYLQYSSTCQNGEQDFTFTGDTLVLEVFETRDSLKFKEYFTEGSANMSEAATVEHYVVPGEDFILIPQRQISYYFFFYGNDTIHLTKPEDLNLQQGNCLIEYPNGDAFIGEEIGFLPDYEYHGIRHQNSRVISCVPGILLLDAYLVYTKDELRMSHTLNPTGDGDFIINGYTLLE